MTITTSGYSYTDCRNLVNIINATQKYVLSSEIIEYNPIKK